MLIVTGMHRSGTSFVANLLNNLGADFGLPSLLVKKDRWNQRGYFENWELVDANNRLILGRHLASAYRRIAALNLRPELKSLLLGLLNLPSFIRPSPAMIVRRFPANEARMRGLAQKYGACVVKDVRFTITIGVWRRVVMNPRLLFCFRHPHEVAMSLRVRQHIPMAKGYSLWAFHVREFLRQAAGLPIVMVNYNLFLSPETAMEELRRLCAYLGRDFNEGDACGILGETLRRDLRHNVGDAAALPPRVDTLYRQLRTLHARFAVATPLPAQGELPQMPNMTQECVHIDEKPRLSHPKRGLVL